MAGKYYDRRTGKYYDELPEWAMKVSDTPEEYQKEYYERYGSSKVQPNSGDQLGKADKREVEVSVADDKVHKQFNPISWIKPLENLAIEHSAKLMEYIRTREFDDEFDINQSAREINEYASPAQGTYLLPRYLQDRVMKEHGYIKGTPGDYGLVKKAVGDRNIPIYQTAPDAINRDQLVVLGNPLMWGDSRVSKPGGLSYSPIMHLEEQKQLVHAGDHPSAVYVDPKTNRIYQKHWDLNDYGNLHGEGGVSYNLLKQTAANVLDLIGSPVVVTTGFQPSFMKKWDNYEKDSPVFLEDILNSGLVKDFYASQNMHPVEDTEGNIISYGAPEVTITFDKKGNANKYSYIKGLNKK